MKKDPDFFKRWLINLDNEKFYYEARNFLPETTTPFNQEIVSENLISFFLNDEKANALLSTIDSVDSLLLGILYISNGASTGQILKLIKPFEKSVQSENKEFVYYSYFENNKNIEAFSYVSLIEHISNLSKRLIILSIDNKFILNPIFGEDIIKKASLLPILYNDNEYLPELNSNVINGEFLRGYLSIVKTNPKLTDYQKRNYVSLLFPSYSVEELIKTTELVDDLLSELEIFKPFDTIEYEILQKLIDLSSFDLAVLFLSKAIAPLFDNYDKVFIFAKKVLNYLINLKIFDEKALKFILETQVICFDIEQSDELIQKLLDLRIIQKSETNYQVNKFEKTLADPQPLIFDTDLTVKYIGNRGRNDILWRFASLCSYDIQTTYKLSKEDFRDALDSSMKKETVIKYIMENCNNLDNCSALNYFDLIEKQYSQLSVYDGIIIQADKRISRIIEHHPEMEEFILKKLADGVYLMSREKESQWTSLLEKAGLIVPRRKGDLIQSETFYTNEQWRISKNYHLQQDQLAIIDALETIEKSLSEFEKLILKNEVSQKTFNSKPLRGQIELSDLNKPEKMDLKNRLRNSMIVDESQIAPLVLDTDISASGFEFRRKVNVCKMASKEENTVLKVTYLTHELLLLVEKVKAETQNEYFVVARKLPTLETVTLPISKIFNAKIMNYVIN
ncbi:MAG: hypothetical protein ACPKNR_07875 [Pleomorphochaeta sp.]